MKLLISDSHELLKTITQGDSSFDSQMCLCDDMHKTGYHPRKRTAQVKEIAHSKALRQKRHWQVWETKTT